MSREDHILTLVAPLDRLDLSRSIHGVSVLATIGSRLQVLYGDLAREPIPPRFARLLERLDRRAPTDD
jgi:hypothetical protein